MKPDAERRLAIAIRRAGTDDRASLLAIDPMGGDRVRSERVRQAIDEGTCWLADDDDETVGYVVVDERFFDRPFSWLLVVRASDRRRGIGTALVHHAIGLAPGRRIFTSTNESNAAARSLFEGLGFVTAGRVDHLDDGDPEMVYVRLPDGSDTK